jgi:hypothetical protein
VLNLIVGKLAQYCSEILVFRALGSRKVESLSVLLNLYRNINNLVS